MEPFPAAKNQTMRAGKKYSSISVKVYCHCRRTDNYGSEMFGYDGPCAEWLHVEYLDDVPVCSDKWYCNNCSKDHK